MELTYMMMTQFQAWKDTCNRNTRIILGERHPGIYGGSNPRNFIRFCILKLQFPHNFWRELLKGNRYYHLIFNSNKFLQEIMWIYNTFVHVIAICYLFRDLIMHKQTNTMEMTYLVELQKQIYRFTRRAYITHC